MGCGLWTLKACPQLSCCTRGNWLIPGGAAPPGAARSQLSKHGVQKLGNVVMTEGQSFFLEHLLLKDPLTSQSPLSRGVPCGQVRTSLPIVPEVCVTVCGPVHVRQSPLLHREPLGKRERPSVLTVLPPCTPGLAQSWPQQGLGELLKTQR